jgi:hypothetical protein
MNSHEVVASVPGKSGLVTMTNSDNGHLVMEKLLLEDNPASVPRREDAFPKILKELRIGD